MTALRPITRRRYSVLRRRLRMERANRVGRTGSWPASVGWTRWRDRPTGIIVRVGWWAVYACLVWRDELVAYEQVAGWGDS